MNTNTFHSDSFADATYYNTMQNGRNYPQPYNLNDRCNMPPMDFGQDNAADAYQGHTPIYRISPRPKAMRFAEAREQQQPQTQSREESGYLQVSMPSQFKGLTTFGHQTALRNRVKFPRLFNGNDLDMTLYTPTFVHDVLMLPGTLSKTMEKGSQQDCMHKMTPALLPGFHPNIHPETKQPCLTPARSPMDHVKGMLVLGQGKYSRNLIHQHYRSNATRVKLRVEIDVAYPIPRSERDRSGHHTWKLRRVSVWAHVWVYRNPNEFPTDIPRWTMEALMAGELAYESPTKKVHPTRSQSNKDDDAAWVNTDWDNKSTSTSTSSSNSRSKQSNTNGWNDEKTPSKGSNKW